MIVERLTWIWQKLDFDNFQPELLKTCNARLVCSHDMPGFRKSNYILIDLATKVNKMGIGRNIIMQLHLYWDLLVPPTHTQTYTIGWLPARSCFDLSFILHSWPRAGCTHSCLLLPQFTLQLAASNIKVREKIMYPEVHDSRKREGGVWNTLPLMV